MHKFSMPWRPVVASVLLGLAGCGGEQNNNNDTPDSGVVEAPDSGTPDAGTPEVAECEKQIYSEQPTVVAHTDVSGKKLLTVDGKQFRDLNANDTLDPYEDWRLSAICRAKDLVTKMTVPQKIGLLSEGSYVGSGTADGTIPDNVKANIVDRNIRQALMRVGSRTPTELAVYLNNIQELAETLDLGIPVAITADPIHGMGLSTAAATGAMSYSTSIVSAWPYPLGLGAASDVELTRQYGDTVRQEFMAMGFRWQLGPMADLASEPRWARVQNTFGENAFAVAKHTKACVEGFQGGATGDLRNAIAATIKHFPGAGTNENGMDSHSFFGRYNVFPANNFDYHLIPFQAAFDSKVASFMACYSVFKGQYQHDPFQVPSGFSYGIITRLAKEQMGFDGMVTGDWGTAGSRAWGLEALSTAERAAMWLKAGSHQFGSDPESYFKDAFDKGLIIEADIDGAAIKILEMSFKLGIFENPYVNPDETANVTRSAENRLKGFDAQKRAIVLLRNGANQNSRILPIAGDRALVDANADGTVKVYFDGVVDAITGSDPLDDVLEGFDYTDPGNPTATPAVLPIVQATDLADADVAVIRIVARKGTYFGLDDGVPLSFDAPFPGTMNDSGRAAAVKDAQRVIDAFRVRDGYTKSDGTIVAAANPTLKIVLVMHMDRPGIVKPFINGLTTLDETPGEPGSYPLVSNEANIKPTISGGVDAFLVDFGAFDRAVLDFVFNKNLPAGVTAHGTARLPIEIPSSDAEVDAQLEDLPSDTRNPTYRIGSGMTL